MIELIIFDYDGVIVDSFSTVHKVYQSICLKLGKKCPASMAKFRKIYGSNSRSLMKNLGFTPEEIKRADIFYKEKIVNYKPNFFPRIAEVIKQLSQNYKLILVSSNLHNEVTSKLKKLNVFELFDSIHAGKIGPMKKPDVLVTIMKKHHADPKNVVMIGDRMNDYYDARKAGIKNIILVEYGWGYDKNKVPSQKMVVDKPSDLLEAINRI